MKRKISYSFDQKVIREFRELLMPWYDENKRDLPWRRAALNTDKQQHAYAVWVSEIMLQQTRVATVIDYYKKWMSKWPTVVDLASASLDQVNEVWAGLGYYSRARRLHEGAVKVVKDLDRKIPETSAELIKLIPGVGRYTAAAISSIAFGESVGVLDGNVIRVLCRLLTIGGDVSSKNILEHLWSQVESLIPSEKPGDFNQAMMELGALICSPKSPQCANCPLLRICKARKQVEDYKISNSVLSVSKKRKRKIAGEDNVKSKRSKNDSKMEEKDSVPDIESCADVLALPAKNPWIPELGVMNYPRKAEKKPPRQETALISVVEMEDLWSPDSTKFLISQRPKSGLLAGLWEFPTVTLTAETLNDNKFQKLFAEKYSTPSMSTRKYISESMDPFLEEHLAEVDIKSQTHVGEYTHIFSHIHLRYIVRHVLVSLRTKNPKILDKDPTSSWKWINKDDLRGCAMSSAMHKILKLCHNDENKIKKRDEKPDVKQIKLDAFFKPKMKLNVGNNIKKE